MGGYYDESFGSWKGEKWEPIGTVCCPFSGNVQGNGHRITGLYIDSEKDYQGFFGNNAGNISNLGIESGYIKSTGNYIGGISGTNYNTATIENCYNKANISGERYVGGISGYNNNPYTGGVKIKKSYNSGNIIGNSDVGGIVGHVWTNNAVEECYNKGNITGNKNSNYGGIVGEMSGDERYPSIIKNCYNAGGIFCTGYPTTGGIVGKNNMNCNIIKNCYSVGIIDISYKNYANSGNIAGRNYRSDRELLLLQ